MTFLPFLLSFFVACLLTPLVIHLYRRIGLVEKPNKKKPMTTHEHPVPRGGGIPIFFGVVLTLLLLVPVDQRIVGIVVGALMLAVIGILDDRYNINPYLRLLLVFIASTIVVFSGIGIPFLNLPFVGIVRLDIPRLSFWFFGEMRYIWILADLFAIVWIVSLSNFVNWSKGVDGQLPGIITVAAITVGLLALRSPGDNLQTVAIVLSFATAGAYAGFLPWNFYPQRIMPGYGAGTLGGYFLAVIAILSTAKVGTLFVVLGIPLIDAGFSIIRRILSGKSPVWGDRGHLHHHLLDHLHWSKRKIALFYWGITAILGVLALQLNSQQKFYTMLGVSLVIGGILLWLTHGGQSSKPHVRNDG